MADLPRKARSLYANLLGDDSSTISSAPVKYDVNKADHESSPAGSGKPKDASLQFQPIKRPQVKAKAKPASVVANKSSLSASTEPTSSDTALSSTQPAQHSGTTSKYDQWRGDPDENAYWAEQRRQERKAQQKEKRKGKKNTSVAQRQWNWDDIYDPEAPNVYSHWRGSDAQYNAIRAWKAKLYHRKLNRPKASIPDRSGSDESPPRRIAPSMFAPPSFEDVDPRRDVEMEDDGVDISDTYRADQNRQTERIKRQLNFAPASIDVSTAGDDTYSRTVEMQDQRAPSPFLAPPPPPPPPPKDNISDASATMPTAAPADSSAAPSDSPAVTTSTADLSQTSNVDTVTMISDAKAAALEKARSIQARLNAMRQKATNDAMTAPPPPPADTTMQPIDFPPPPPPPPPPQDMPDEVDISRTISRAPLRYESAQATAKQPEAPPSKRPGQANFAERLMMKQGWKKGQGLGAQEDGITTAVTMKAEKRKKRPDAEGGGFVSPAMGRIVGGKRRKIDTMDDDDGRFGQPSMIIRLAGMLAGLDVDHELEDRNLLQRIGDRMQANGSIERIVIWRESDGGHNEVFVEFHSPLSALRAVNMNDVDPFEGNKIVARFYPADKFHAREYE